MAGKNHINIDFGYFADYAARLDELGADLQHVLGDAMEEAGERVQHETQIALDNANLPAHGNYSTGDTEDAMVKPSVEWHGPLGVLPLGFDKSKRGAGGWLITGTPKMQPDTALSRIYRGKRYTTTIKNSIRASLQRAIDERMGGGD